MENNRPRISSLTEKELASLLITSFFKVGKEVKLSAVETKIFLEEVYKHQGRIYIDTFGEAFSTFAALELPGAETLRPQVSPMFVSIIMKLYFAKCKENRRTRESGKSTSTVLTSEEKYTLFVQHTNIYKSLPVNPDWVTIYEYLIPLEKLALHPGWDSLSFSGKWKYAMNEVSEWAYRQYNINE